MVQSNLSISEHEIIKSLKMQLQSQITVSFAIKIIVPNICISNNLKIINKIQAFTITDQNNIQHKLKYKNLLKLQQIYN